MTMIPFMLLNCSEQGAGYVIPPQSNISEPSLIIQTRPKLKAILRKLKIRLLPQLPHGIAQTFSLIRPSDCAGWFSAAAIPC